MMKKYSNSKSLKTSLLFPSCLFNKIESTPKNFILFLLIFLGYNNVYSQSPSTFTTSGTWICPRGVTLIQVEAIGAGAGGRTANGTKGHVGGGGGGGAYSKRVGVTVVPGTSYTITVGTSVANTNGTSSTASFGIVTITAVGGSVGAGSGTGTIAGGAGGTVLASLGDVGSVFAGGAGGSGLGDGTAAGAGAGGGGGSGAGSAIVGNAGGNALTTATGGIAGGTVTNYGGAGGAGGNNGAAGANASTTNYGGGGGGGGEKAAGGVGRNGVIIITFNCPTETAAAGPDQSICLSTATLAGNTPISAGLTGLWTVVSGTATITTPASPTSGVTGLLVGISATLRWTIDNGRCGSTSDDVIINNTMPAAIGGGATTVCTGANTVAFTNATAGGTWSITNGTGLATITAGGIATGGTAGTVDVVYTLGTCSVIKALTVNQTPPAIGGGAASVCTGATTPAFTNATGGGTWSITNGTGTATISAGGAVTGSTAGTVTIVYTVGSCSASTALTVNTTPAAIGGGALSVCTGANTVAFTNATAGGTWSITNGTGSATITAGGIATGVTAGTVDVVYTLGTCSVIKALTVNQTPPAIAGGAASVCVGATTPAFTNATSGGTWSITNGTGTATISAGSAVTGSTAGTVTIVYTVGSCSASTALTVNTTPAAIAGGALSVCTGANTVAFTNATAGGTWSITNGTGSATITAGGIATGVTAGTVDVVYTLGTCSVIKALTINQTPPAIGGGAASVCVGATTPAFTNATGGGTWSITNGTGTATISAGGVVTGSTAGTVTVVYTVGSCSASTALTVNTTPAAIAGGALTVCTGSNTVAFTDATAGGTWSITNGTGSATITAGGIATGVTAGTVTVVYTVGSCSATKALTVNQTPAAIGGGATSVCTGALTPAFTNSFAGGTWSITNGTGTATVSAGGVVTGGTAGNVTVVYTIGTCTPVTVALIVSTIPSVSITPSPTNAATALCYSGVGAITSISWAATATATSYDVYFGAGSLPVTVTANVTNNSYTTGILLSNTTYYWRVVARNSCGPGPTSATWTFTTYSSPCYCTPTASSGMDGTGITNVSYSTVNNTTNNTIVYNDYTSLVGNVVQGAAMPIAVTTATANKRYNIKIWIDWNNDGDFTDTGEEMFTGNVLSNTINGTLNIPLLATLGNHTMRVGITQGQGNGSNYEIPTPCFTGVRGQYEDYTINIIADACVGSVPTVSTSPVNRTVANGGNTTFAATFANTPTSFVWEVSSDGGTNFTTITNGGVYSTATTATLTITGVTSGMNGFIYRVSASNACGTSAYATLATLTVSVSYCSATSTSGTNYIAGISSEGNLNDVSNPSLYSINGYGDYSTTTIARQIPGGGININIDLGGPTRQFIECYVDWNGDGVFTEPGEQVYNSSSTSVFSTSFGFVVPVTQSQGNYRMRVRTKTTDATIVPCGAYTSGETEDYTIAIVPDCAAIIDSVTSGSVCGANNPVTISAVGLGGTTKYRWYTSLTGGTYVETSTGTYSPTLSATQIYYVTAYNGSCESLVRTKVVAKVIPTANITFSPSSPVVCGEDVVVAISAASDFVEQDIFTEDFEGTSIGLTATMPTGVIPTSAGTDSPWSVETSTYQPTTTAVWRPAINSGSIDNKFGFSSSDYSGANIVTRYTTTSSYNTTSFISLALSFDFYFSYYLRVNETFKAQISENGTTWVDLASYGSDQGSASRFKTVTITVPTTYLNKPSIFLRFQYTSDGWSDGVAIDNIRFYGIKQLNTSFSWISATPVSGYTDLACTTNYTNQLVSTIYLKPTLTQMEATSFPITVTASLANGCPITQVMTVSNNSRVWKGVDLIDPTNWNDVDNWKPAAIPTIDNCVIIPNTSIVKGTAYQAYAKNLVVKSTGNLNVQTGNSITVKEWVNVNDAAGGVFELENTASLVQVDNVATNNNIGKIKYKRNTNLRRYDYTYLSSPVEGQVVNTVTQAPLVTGPVYKWNPTIANPNGGEGNWENALGNTMEIARGYTVRSPDSFPFTSSTYFGLFNGKPNNGIITYPVSRGTWSFAPPYLGNNGTEINSFSDNWNLIGNPYPSSIRGSQFLFDNRTKIEGNIRIWTHATLPNASQSQPFYGSFGYNYTPNDYLSYNFTGTSCCPLAGPEIYVGAGQGFFVQMIDGPAITDFVTFNNTLRDGIYDNSFFFRNANPSTAINTDPIDVNNLQRNRIWLDLVNSTNQSSRILIGNIERATNDRDSFFDANAEISGAFTFYSLIGVDKFFIQGRALPFDITDEVPLGIKVPTSGTYSIAIAAVDGYFNENNIFIKDMLLNTIHALKSSPYQFTSAAGIFNDRFKIVYSNSTLNNPDFDYKNSVKIVTNDVIQVQSTKESIDTIVVYDILGRTLGTYTKINANEFIIHNLLKTNTALLLQIKLQNGIIVNEKVIY